MATEFTSTGAHADCTASRHAARRSEELGAFEDAAAAWETYAQDCSDAPEATRGLALAVQYWSASGQSDALRRALQLSKERKAWPYAERAAIALDVATHAVSEEHWREALEVLLGVKLGALPLLERVRHQGLLSLVRLRLGQRVQAREAARKAQAWVQEELAQPPSKKAAWTEWFQLLTPLRSAIEALGTVHVELECVAPRPLPPPRRTGPWTPAWARWSRMDGAPLVALQDACVEPLRVLDRFMPPRVARTALARVAMAFDVQAGRVGKLTAGLSFDPPRYYELFSLDSPFRVVLELYAEHAAKWAQACEVSASMRGYFALGVADCPVRRPRGMVRTSADYDGSVWEWPVEFVPDVFLPPGHRALEGAPPHDPASAPTSATVPGGGQDQARRRPP